MSKASEKANGLVRGCMSALQLHGILAVRFNNQPLAHRVGDQLVGYRRLGGPRGIPDIWAVTPGGRLLACECKAGRGRVSEDQRDFMDRLHKQGAIVVVARSVVDVIELCELGRRDGWHGVVSPWVRQRDGGGR